MKILPMFAASTALAACAVTPEPALAAGKPTALHITCPPVVEGALASCAVTKTGGNGRAVKIEFGTADGTAKAPGDYVASSGGQITLGKAPVTVSVQTLDDALVENPETFDVRVKITSTGASAVGTVTIGDNDTAAPPPPPPTTEPVPPPEPAPTDYGLRQPIPTTDFDITQSYGAPGAIPPVNADAVGAFRFVCTPGFTYRYDDNVVLPGKPGASHLHDNTGNRDWDAFSTYESLREHGGSSCNNIAADDEFAGRDRDPVSLAKKEHWAANRTPYYIPALLDGRGNIIQGDLEQFYYKRLPASSPECNNKAIIPGGCVDLPFGLKFIAGNRPNHPEDYRYDGNGANPYDAPLYRKSAHNFECIGGPKTSFGEDMLGALKCAQDAYAAGNTNAQFGVSIGTPTCWDGVHTDTPDHRSHLARQTDDHQGHWVCDAAHPYLIPQFIFSRWWTILPTDDVTKIHFSSDEADPSLPAGWSIHVDYAGMGWDPVVFRKWMDNCINKRLDCKGGQLGDGTGLKGAWAPFYKVNGHWVALWKNPNRLIPVPPRPAPMDMAH